MKRSKTSARGARNVDRHASARPSAKVRRHAAVLKLESLEERTLLSGTKKAAFKLPTSPVGLGATYTMLSERAHGVSLVQAPTGHYVPGGSSTGTSGTYTMADFDAYLKQLKRSLDKVTGQEAQSPGSPKATNPSPSPSNSHSVNQDNSQSGSQPVFSIKDPAAVLTRLKLDPSSSGISTTPLEPSVVSGFDGMNFLDSVNGYVPPDTSIAVGSQYVVETVNAQIQFYSKATGQALLPNTPLSNFFGQPSESPYQAVATYDDIAGRYIVVSNTGSGDLLLAVSNDGNPLDGFDTYNLSVSQPNWFNYETRLGWNDDEVVVTFDQYSFTGAAPQAEVISLATPELLFASSPPTSLALGSDYFISNGTFNDFGLTPATMHGAAPRAPMYFVEENTIGDGNDLRVVAAADLLSNSPIYTDTIVPVDPYTEPPEASQPTGPIITNNSEILNAYYRDGLLVAGQNIGLTTDTDAHARWYELSTSGSPSLVQDGTISPAPGTDTYYPAVAIAPGDVIGMTYNQSSLTEFPSVYDTGRTTSTPSGTMQTPVIARSGDAAYQDFDFGQWGNYNSLAVDPTDGTFWSGAEYSTFALSGDPANWATWISHFVTYPLVTTSSPAVGSIVTGSAPSTFSLTFSEPIDPSSISASSFTVDGTPANTASLSGNGLTITYAFSNSPLVKQGTETMSLPAGSVTGLGDETGNAAFSGNFQYVVTQLQVSSHQPGGRLCA